MRRRAWMIPVALLVGCAAEMPPPTLPAPPPEPTTVEETMAAPALPPPEWQRPVASDPLVSTGTPGTGLQATERAYRQAVIYPRAEWFDGVILTYPWQDGKVYVITTSEHNPTMLA